MSQIIYGFEFAEIVLEIIILLAFFSVDDNDDETLVDMTFGASNLCHWCFTHFVIFLFHQYIEI